MVVDCPTSAVEHQYVPEFYRNSAGQWSVVQVKEKGDCEEVSTQVQYAKEEQNSCERKVKAHLYISVECRRREYGGVERK